MKEYLKSVWHALLTRYSWVLHHHIMQLALGYLAVILAYQFVLAAAALLVAYNATVFSAIMTIAGVHLGWLLFDAWVESDKKPLKRYPTDSLPPVDGNGDQLPCEQAESPPENVPSKTTAEDRINRLGQWLIDQYENSTTLSDWSRPVNLTEMDGNIGYGDLTVLRSVNEEQAADGILQLSFAMLNNRPLKRLVLISRGPDVQVELTPGESQLFTITRQQANSLASIMVMGVTDEWIPVECLDPKVLAFKRTTGE